MAPAVVPRARRARSAAAARARRPGRRRCAGAAAARSAAAGRPRPARPDSPRARRAGARRSRRPASGGAARAGRRARRSGAPPLRRPVRRRRRRRPPASSAPPSSPGSSGVVRRVVVHRVGVPGTVGPPRRRLTASAAPRVIGRVRARVRSTSRRRDRRRGRRRTSGSRTGPSTGRPRLLVAVDHLDVVRDFLGTPQDHDHRRGATDPQQRRGGDQLRREPHRVVRARGQPTTGQQGEQRRTRAPRPAPRRPSARIRSAGTSRARRTGQPDQETDGPGNARTAGAQPGGTPVGSAASSGNDDGMPGTASKGETVAVRPRTRRRPPSSAPRPGRSAGRPARAG